MLITSTVAVIGVLACVVLGLSMRVGQRRARELALQLDTARRGAAHWQIRAEEAEKRLGELEQLNPWQTYAAAHVARLSCAQHWLRGGALSQPAEAWRPIVSAFGCVALMVETEEELAALLETTAQVVQDDPELANMWAQARGELANVRRLRERQQIAFLTGYRADGSPDWHYPLLRTQATQLLESAIKGARALLHARRSPSASPAAS